MYNFKIFIYNLQKQKHISLKKIKYILKELVIYKLRNDTAVAPPWEKQYLTAASDKF